MHLDPLICKKRIEEAAELIDEIPLPVGIEKLIECFIFSVNDYVTIKEVADFEKKKKYFRSLLIKYLHRGSFEYLIADPTMDKLKKNLYPGMC